MAVISVSGIIQCLSFSYQKAFALAQWPVVQMGTFNKEIGFLCGLKFFFIEYILYGVPTIESTFDVANMVKTATVKDVPINNDALLNIQAC